MAKNISINNRLKQLQKYLQKKRIKNNGTAWLWVSKEKDLQAKNYVQGKTESWAFSKTRSSMPKIN